MKKTNKTKKPLVIGLTGSIGMGKSTAAIILHNLSLPVYDADRVVRGLLARGSAGVKPVARLFPETLKRGSIDREALGRIVFAEPKRLKQLERILHPFVRQAERAFLAEAAKNKAKAVVLDIPLLFETGGERRCDVTICMTAPRVVQQTRLLNRPGMTASRIRAIQKRQMPDREKQRRADFVISSGKGYAYTKKQLTKLWAFLREERL
jgi:dephospho-CoA kinase